MYKTLSLKNELLRKTIHVFNSLIPLSLCLFRQDYITIGVGVALTVWLLLEFFRLSNKKAKSVYRRIFGRVTRKFEDSSLTGATYVLLSSFIILFFFSKYVCIAALLIMSFSDTFAAIIGKIYGKTRIGNKTLEGSFAFLLVSFLIVVIMSPYLNIFQSLVAIVVVTVVELFPINNIDDNFSVPIICAIIMSIGI